MMSMIEGQRLSFGLRTTHKVRIRSAYLRRPVSTCMMAKRKGIHLQRIVERIKKIGKMYLEPLRRHVKICRLV